MAHAIDLPHLPGCGEALLQAFDDAGERLVDDGGRPARLPNDRIAAWKISHAQAPPGVLEAAQCPTAVLEASRGNGFAGGAG
jgi:hypothetical protein